MNPMILYRKYSQTAVLVLLALLLNNSAPAQAQPRMDELFGLIESHEYGRSYDTLTDLDEAVIRATQDEDLRRELEQRFIRLLETSNNQFALQYACRQIYLIGTEASVPAVAPLLRDPELSHMARYALMNIKDDAATNALRSAMQETTGDLKAGMIRSLADRGDPTLLYDFISMIEDPDETVALAAIRALGRVGGRTEIPALESVSGRSEAFYREANNAMLAIAERLLQKGASAEAGKIYSGIYREGKTVNLRMAGLKGMMAAGTAKKEKILVEALSGADPEIRGFAGRLISDPAYEVRALPLARSLKKISVEGKVVLIDALGERRASETKPMLLKYGEDPAPEVQAAVVRAMGFIGNAEDVAFLAGKAAGRERIISQAAQVSLSQLDGEGIEPALVREMKSGDTPVQAALVSSLTTRGAGAAKGDILSMIGSSDRDVRIAVLDYLREQGDAADLQALIDFMATAGSRAESARAERALTSICTREGKACESSILGNLQRSEAGVREALIASLNLVGTPAALQAAADHTRVRDPELQKTAVRTLAAWQDTSAMDELKEIKDNNPDQSQRILAFRGYFRLFRSLDINVQDKMREYRRLIRQAERKEEKLLVLSAFQDIRTIDGLKRVEIYLYDPEMSHETCLTLLRISDFLEPKYKSDVAVAMMQILKVSDDENVLEDVHRRFDKFGIEPSDYFDDPDQAKPDAATRIVMISGPMDHAWYDAHEYPKDLLFLKQCLEHSPDLKDVRVDFYLTTERIPLEAMEGADVIVVHSSADRAPGEVHALFPNNRKNMEYTAEEKAYYEKLDGLVKTGMGVVTLHYAVWTDFPESREYMLDWVGGYYKERHSNVRMDSVPVMLASRGHPVLNGVKPWHLREEYYINQVFRETGRKVTPLINVNMPLRSGHEPADYAVAWALERRDGGRGLAFTGCHTHSYLHHEDYRRFLVNGIAWAAGLRIPQGGLRTGIPEGWEQ